MINDFFLNTLEKQLCVLTSRGMLRSENIVGKGENAGDQHFLLFPQCFLPFPKQISIFSVTFTLLSANALNFDKSRILSLGKELYITMFQNLW